MREVLFFNEEEAIALSLSGGKGSNLAKMSQANFPVPFGMIVTAEAYRQFIAQADFLPAMLCDLDYTHPDKLVEQAAHIRQILAQLELPENVVQSICEKLRTFPAETCFSVRSSSTMEDLSGAAFAGQHDTFLNCYGETEILQKIRDCFISLWHDRAILYRHQQGFTQADVTMAVVVQKMVNAEKAGVGFSINPISSNVNEIMINANYGLGESVVSGEAEIDQFIVNKKDLSIVNASIAHKEICILPVSGGTIEKVIESDKQDISCLSNDEVVKIAKLNQAVEKHYAFPQDIEWAIEKGELYLLQARPITTIAPHWTRDESAERYPNVLTPFTWDYVEKAFHISLKHSFELMGLPPFDGKWFAMFDNYIYGNQNAVWLYMDQSPINIQSADDLAAQLPALIKRFNYALTLPNKWMRNLDSYLEDIGGLMHEKIDDYNINELWDYLQRIVHLGTEYFKPNIAISITQAMLYKVFKGLIFMLTKDMAQTNRLFDAITATTETKTATVNGELYDLAQMINQNTRLKKSVLEQTSIDFLANSINTFSVFKTAFYDFLACHGHREVDFDAYIPTWIEQPNVVLDNIRLIVKNPETKTPLQKAIDVQYQKYEAMRELMTFVPENLRFFMTELISFVQTYTVLDDVEHYQTTRLTLPVRRGVIALGKCLMARGIVTEASDVFFAHIATLEACVKGDKSWQDLTAEIAFEKEQYYKNALRTPQWDLSVTYEEIITADQTVLTGLAGSAGVVEGEVYLIHSTDDFADFPKGAILVARTTNPAWTPLFYNASGLITESGGPLSHGAVTAREMKLPAVMSVRNVMKTLRNGQKVKVDGNIGQVIIM